MFMVHFSGSLLQRFPARGSDELELESNTIVFKSDL